MRKGIFGLLAYGLTGLQIAQAQTGPGASYQEPLPIQPSAPRYGAAPYASPRFPSYGPATYLGYAPTQPSIQAPAVYGMPSGYAAPTNAAPYARPTTMSPGTGIIQAAAQEPVPPFQTPVPMPFAGSQNVSPPPSRPTEIVNDLSHVDDGSPAEPAEPYMVGPAGTWKPAKGYSFYGSADYLFWWVQRQPLPGGLSLSLSNPTSVPALTTHGESGARFFLGTWLDDRQDVAVEGGYFFLGTRSANNAQTFPGSAISNRPIFDGIASESTLLSTSTSLQGAEANLRYQAWRCGGAGERDRWTGYLDLLGGFRFVDLSEALTINSTTLFGTAPVLLSNALLTTTDSFGTHNHLFAGQFGADAGVRFGHFSVNAYTKLALGDNRQTVIIDGNTQVSGPAAVGNLSVPGGFFAQPSNIGRFSRDEFSVLPEVGINLGYKLGDHCRLGVGYTFIYFANVVRPGEQIDVTAGGATRPPISFLGGPQPQPVFSSFHESGFWAQGLNVMVELSY